MGKVLIALIAGILIGGALTFWIFVGVPGSEVVHGLPIQPPDPNGPPPGTARIVLREELFNAVLNTIYTQMNAPSFPLGPTAGADAAEAPPGSCISRIVILQEGSGVRTGVTFANDRLSSPLAFSGEYSSIFGCLKFTGSAQASLDLRFDPSSKAVYGQMNVETVNLDGVNPLVGAMLTPIVQSTINARVNPIKIVDGRQLATNLPIAAANGNLIADVTDVRAEVREGALNLYVTYGFEGGTFAPLPSQPALP